MEGEVSPFVRMLVSRHCHSWWSPTPSSPSSWSWHSTSPAISSRYLHQYCKTNHLHSTNPAISSQYFHQYCKLSILVMWRFHYLVDVVGWVRWNPQHICLVLHPGWGFWKFLQNFSVFSVFHPIDKLLFLETAKHGIKILWKGQGNSSVPFAPFVILNHVSDSIEREQFERTGT